MTTDDDDTLGGEWVDHVLGDMVPKLEESRMCVSLVPSDHTAGDVKFWVELGASIMMDKPVIAVVIGDRAVPAKLEQVADEIVRFDEGIDLQSSPRILTEAIQRVMAAERYDTT